LASLKGIDRVLGTLEEFAANAPRPYQFVILSDHGQSQGATFKQRYGIGLEDLVRQLTSDQTPVATSGEDEQSGRVKTFLAELGSEKGLIGRLSRRVLHGPAPQGPAPEQPRVTRPSLVVVASGNLGMVYFADLPGRQTVDEIEARHPHVLNGLVNHPGIGFVMVRSTDGPIVFGKDGVRYLDDGRVVGEDPLARFGPHAETDLRRHDNLPHVGDIVINSRLDAATDEVAAFEELVGCHGGLGGWQTRAVLVHPVDWPIEDTLDGSDAVHRQLIRWLERAGLRQPQRG
jgi:hypothetical protein